MAGGGGAQAAGGGQEDFNKLRVGGSVIVQARELAKKIKTNTTFTLRDSKVKVMKYHNINIKVIILALRQLEDDVGRQAGHLAAQFQILDDIGVTEPGSVEMKLMESQASGKAAVALCAHRVHVGRPGQVHCDFAYIYSEQEISTDWVTVGVHAVGAIALGLLFTPGMAADEILALTFVGCQTVSNVAEAKRMLGQPETAQAMVLVAMQNAGALTISEDQDEVLIGM